MDRTINASVLRNSLRGTVRRVRRGERITVLYRSQPALSIVPVKRGADDATLPLTEDPIYQAPAVGRSADGSLSREHDRVLYGTRTKRRR